MKGNAYRFAILCIAVLWGQTASNAQERAKRPAKPPTAEPAERAKPAARGEPAGREGAKPAEQGGPAESDEPDRLEFAVELKKVQGAKWESPFINGMKAQIQIQKDKTTVGMCGKGKQPDSMSKTMFKTEAIEDGEERSIILKDKTMVFSYRLDGKDLTVVFGEYLQAEFNEKAFNLPETVTLKPKGKK